MELMVPFTCVSALLIIGVPVYSQESKDRFSCVGRTSGYYADIETGCQVYHMCDGLGRQFSYMCPNNTLFQQRMLVCDHWYMVNCSKAELDYSANLLIGQKGKPFVEDSEMHPYYRTPRPDLLTHQTNDSEYNLVDRIGRAHLVGVELQNDNKSESDEVQYSLPSHWSTEYSNHSSTASPVSQSETQKNIKDQSLTRTDKKLLKSNIKASGKSLESKTTDLINSVIDKNPIISNFSGNRINTKNNFSTVEKPPSSVLSVKPKKSLSVAETTKRIIAPTTEPIDILSINNLPEIPALSLEIEPPKVTNAVRNVTQEVPAQTPSIFYQPPKFEPDYTLTTKEEEAVEKKEENKKPIHRLPSINGEKWNDLRKLFSIPDYNFPLDSATRPSYEETLTSFHVKPVKR